jgi:hypothetical protein
MEVVEKKVRSETLIAFLTYGLPQKKKIKSNNKSAHVKSETQKHHNVETTIHRNKTKLLAIQRHTNKASNTLARYPKDERKKKKKKKKNYKTRT